MASLLPFLPADAGGPVLLLIIGVSFACILVPVFLGATWLLEAAFMHLVLRVPFTKSLGVSAVANILSLIVGIVLLIVVWWFPNSLNFWEAWFVSFLISVLIEIPVWNTYLKKLTSLPTRQIVSACFLGNLLGYVIGSAFIAFILPLD